MVNVEALMMLKGIPGPLLLGKRTMAYNERMRRDPMPAGGGTSASPRARSNVKKQMGMYST